MFSQSNDGARAYARVGVETGVMSANSHELISMLYAGVRQAIARARMHLQQGNVGPRGEAISKAISIIESGLQGALDKEVGRQIAERLDALYSYMARRLLQANLIQSEAMLIEVDGLLATLEQAWAGIALQVTQQEKAVKTVVKQARSDV